MDVGGGLCDAGIGDCAVLPEGTLCRLWHGVLLSGDDGVWLHCLDAARDEKGGLAHPAYPPQDGVGVVGCGPGGVAGHLSHPVQIHG